MRCANAATAPPKPVANSITITNTSVVVISNYPFQFGRPFLQRAIPHAPQVLINGRPVTTQADVKNRYPDGSVEFDVMAVAAPSLPNNTPVMLSFADTTRRDNTPLTQAQMLDPSYNFDAVMTLTPASGAAQTASARQMVSDGNRKPWTSGQIAQTMICADDSAARKYDIGFGDGYHPFRPRFYATFWPATHQVYVRAVGENGLTTELEHLAYKLSISVGSASPTVVYTSRRTSAASSIAIRRDVFMGQAQRICTSSVTAARHSVLLETRRRHGVGHIPFPLAWSIAAPAAAGADAKRAVVTRHLQENGLADRIEIATSSSETLRIRWRPRQPDATMVMIIPTRDNAADVREFTDSLLATAARPDCLSIFVLDNDSRPPARQALGRLERSRLQISRVEEPFNWSRLNNLGAHQTEAPCWFSPMTTCAC